MKDVKNLEHIIFHALGDVFFKLIVHLTWWDKVTRIDFYHLPEFCDQSGFSYKIVFTYLGAEKSVYALWLYPAAHAEWPLYHSVEWT